MTQARVPSRVPSAVCHDSPGSPSWPRLATALAILAIAPALVGCLGDSSPPATTLNDTITLPSGTFAEANVNMTENADLAYRWNATGARLSFDLHAHRYFGTETYTTSEAETGQGTFTAPNNATYSLRWDNRGDEPVELFFQLEGSFTLHSIDGSAVE